MSTGIRSIDRKDGNEQDIAASLAEIKRLVLCHRSGELSHFILINVLELLLQSARTRLCVFRLADINQLRQVQSFTAASIYPLLAFHTFRQTHYLHYFCEQVAALLNQHGADWLIQNSCLVYQLPPYQLAICLARVSTETSQLTLGRREEQGMPEMYRRLDALFKLQQATEPELAQTFYQCFKAVPSPKPLAAPDENIGLHCKTDSTISLNFMYERHLEPILEWVEAIYSEYRQIPLVQVGNPSPIPTHSTIVDYSNLFFFLRVNAEVAPEANQEGTWDGFAVKLICPEQQQREFSRFFHFNRRQMCPWYQSQDQPNQQPQCQIHGVSTCLLEPYWQTLPVTETDENRIHAHYQTLWQRVTSTPNATPTLAGATFRTRTIAFERRALSTDNSATHLWRYHSHRQADQIMSCIKHRLLAKPPAEHDNPEDAIPQMLFVPIYSASQPLLAVATVVNAKPAPAKPSTVNEWQTAFQFAGMVYRYLASRFKERARKAYLGLAADAVQQAYETCLNYHAAHVEEKCSLCFIEAANQKLDMLSKIYPYPKINLRLLSSNVINKHLHSYFSISPCGHFGVEILATDYWYPTNDKPLFSEQDVVKKFRTAIERAIAKETVETQQKVRFQRWHLEHYHCLPPPLKGDWQEMAKKLGWDGT